MTALPRRPLHVLVLTLVFPPDNVSTARIMGDLTEDLSALGAKVTVLTTTPHYNPMATSDGDGRLRRWLGRLVQRSDYSRASVFHCLMPRKGSSVAGRVAGWIGFHTVSTILGAVAIRNVDVIFAPSPPLTIGLSAWFVGFLHRAPFVYNVQEIYPDIAVNLGALRPGPVLSVLSRLEQFVYRRAAVMTVIAPRMRARLLEKGVPPAKIRLLPNFVDVADMQQGVRQNGFRRQHDLEHAFIVSYAGNLGPAQGLDQLLSAAKLLASQDRIQFVIVGDGTARDTLRATIEKERLSNCLLLPYQQYETMQEFYSASDISIVPQAPETGFDAIPSKVYRIMACGRPVLALTDPDSDLGRLVEDAVCGEVVPSGQVELLAAVIRAAADAPGRWSEMGESGRRHVTAHYERRAVTRQYFRLLTEVADTR